nr:hypothetical protein [Klebsiella quasipneumoniae]
MADLSLGKDMLQEALLTTAQKRQAVHFLQEAYQCPLGMRITDADQKDLPLTKPVRRSGDNTAYSGEAEIRIRYGYLRIHNQLRRKGWLINHMKTSNSFFPTDIPMHRDRIH